MKQIAFALLLTACALCAAAQPLVLSGQVKNRKDSSLTLYLLYGSAHFRNKPVTIPVADGGQFSKEIKISYPVFALLKWNELEKRVLLSPGRSLHLLLDPEDNTDRMKITGKGSVENALLQQLKIGEAPFFARGDWKENKYARLPPDSLEKQVLEVAKDDINLAERKIALSGLPELQRFILLQEIRYGYQCYLYDFSNIMRWNKTPDWEKFQEKVLDFQPLPGSAALVSSLFANMMLDNYSRIRLNAIGKNFRNDSAGTVRKIEQALGIPFEKLNEQAEAYGEKYIIPWLYAKHNLPESIHDRLLFNKIMEASDGHAPGVAGLLLDTLQHYCPYSQYLPAARQEVEKLRAQVSRQSKNSAIVLHTEKKVTSLKELVTPYAGRIIYLDIWGTWCGPCKMEMEYVPELKKKYAGKNIVFVYLSADKDTDEELWKKYIYLAALEGEHYRLNFEQVQNLWKEVEQAGGIINRYPTYVLFDTRGNMIHPDAERPSSREKLYRQLDEAL
ncbi:MAG: TlpA family protein disulfide reductase [Chitinophagaceae bacterium]|nr:TlpA family protein disulfide reductase [Chitinophagaceae bacterium]